MLLTRPSTKFKTYIRRGSFYINYFNSLDQLANFNKIEIFRHQKIVLQEIEIFTKYSDFSGSLAFRMKSKGRTDRTETLYSKPEKGSPYVIYIH